MSNYADWKKEVNKLTSSITQKAENQTLVVRTENGILLSIDYFLICDEPNMTFIPDNNGEIVVALTSKEYIVNTEDGKANVVKHPNVETLIDDLKRIGTKYGNYDLRIDSTKSFSGVPNAALIDIAHRQVTLIRSSLV